MVPEERELTELTNAQGSKLRRNCILQLIPPDYTDDCIARVEKTLLGAAGKELNEDRDRVLTALVDTFEKIEVNRKHLEDFLRHPIGAITDQDLMDLRGIYKAIKDGYTQPSDYFAVATKSPAAPGDDRTKTEKLTEQLHKKDAEQKALTDSHKPVANVVAEAEVVDAKTEPEPTAEPNNREKLLVAIQEITGCAPNIAETRLQLLYKLSGKDDKLLEDDGTFRILKSMAGRANFDEMEKLTEELN